VKHGEQQVVAVPAQAAHAAHAEMAHTMATVSKAAPPGGVKAEHDTNQIRSAGVAGVLKGLHPATVHFPIALFPMAALTELFVLSRRNPEREAAVKVMLYGGAAGGVVAVIFGWIHTGIWFGGDTLMQLHRWNGMLIAILGLVAAWLAHQNHQSRVALRLFLFPIAALLIVQGFMGGELAHGANHLKL